MFMFFFLCPRATGSRLRYYSRPRNPHSPIPCSLPDWVTRYCLVYTGMGHSDWQRVLFCWWMGHVIPPVRICRIATLALMDCPSVPKLNGMDVPFAPVLQGTKILNHYHYDHPHLSSHSSIPSIAIELLINNSSSFNPRRIELYTCTVQLRAQNASAQLSFNQLCICVVLTLFWSAASVRYKAQYGVYQASLMLLSSSVVSVVPN